MPPVRGCTPCRQAKVKCDGQRPACQRCLRRNLHCEGYRGAGALVLLDETLKAGADSIRSRSLQRPLRKSTRWNSLPSTAQQDNLPTIASTAAADTGPYIQAIEFKDLNALPWLSNEIAASLQQPLKETAIARYFANYVLFPNRHRGDDGYMADLPHLFWMSPPGSCLRLSVEAGSLISFATATKDAAVARESRILYTEALAKLREDISDPAIAKSDETLMAIIVLQFYELFLSSEIGSTAGTHVRGILPILQLRGSGQINSLVGWNLFRIAHRRVQYRNILRRESPSDESFKFLSMLDPQHIEVNIANLSLRNTRMSTESNSLINNLQLSPREKQEQIATAIIEMLRQNDACNAVRSTGGEDNYWVIPAVHSGVRAYSDQWVCSTWNYQRASQLLLHESIVRAVAYLEELGRRTGTTIADFDIANIRTEAHNLIEECLEAVHWLLQVVDLSQLQTNVTPQPPHKELGFYFVSLVLDWILICELTTEEQKKIATAGYSYNQRALSGSL